MINVRATNTTYRGFLLRMWSTDDHTQVRASITDIQTGQAHVFRDVDSLCSWLRREARGVATVATPSSPSGAPEDRL